MNNIKRAALYIRVSTDQQAKHGDSLEEQLYTLTEYVSTNTKIKTYDTYIDDGISGQKLQRDEFQRLLNDIKKGRIDIILFTKLDRWFRNLRHYLNIQELLDKHDVTWQAVSQPFFNTDTAYGRSFVNQSMTFAELEAQMTSERIRAVFDNKVRKGEVVSGKVPLGYSIKNKKLVLNEDADVVKLIFDYFISSSSIRATVKYMDNELGISRDYQSVKQMLKNKKYIGEFRNNKNYCPPLLSRDKFNKIQDLLSKNIRQNKKRDYLFTGLLVCGDCGRKLSASSLGSSYVRQDGTRNLKRRNVYRCPKRKNNSKTCLNKKNIYEHILEDYLIANILPQAEMMLKKQNNKTKSKNIHNQNEKIKKKLIRLKNAYLNDVISLEEYKKDKIDLEKNIVELVDYKEIQANFEKIKNYTTKDFVKQYYNLDPKERNYIWRSIIQNIVIYPNGEIKINFIGL